MRATLRTFGELSITAGAALLLFCAYLLWGTSSYTHDQQVLLRQQLRQGWPPLDQLKLGKAIALLRIPRLGSDYEYAVVEGVDYKQLKRGPGHYPGTALPGEIGNFVLSGHRTTYAAPFNGLGKLRFGDEIVIDTRDARYTYRVTSHEIVEPNEVDVLAPVPRRPGALPTQAMITLSTCHPEYSAAQRLIVYGMLTTTEARKD